MDTGVFIWTKHGCQYLVDSFSVSLSVTYIHMCKSEVQTLSAMYQCCEHKTCIIVLEYWIILFGGE